MFVYITSQSESLTNWLCQLPFDSLISHRPQANVSVASAVHLSLLFVTKWYTLRQKRTKKRIGSCLTEHDGTTFNRLTDAQYHNTGVSWRGGVAYVTAYNIIAIFGVVTNYLYCQFIEATTAYAISWHEFYRKTRTQVFQSLFVC